MNDPQNEKMLKALGKAFDKAATTCSHEREAAIRIAAALRASGFKIVPAKVEVRS